MFLQPLIAELKHLWEVGVETYDVSEKQNFQMGESLLWTISDFPAYSMLSGWSTQILFHSQMVVTHHGLIIIKNLCLTITPLDETRTALLKIKQFVPVITHSVWNKNFRAYQDVGT